jgi:hypothetical protein
MIKITELNALINLLENAGMERDKADDLVMKATVIAQDKNIPVIKAVGDMANPGGHEDSVEYHLSIALRQISVIELNKLVSLNICVD